MTPLFVDVAVYRATLMLYSTDTDRELAVVREKAVDAGAFRAVVCTHWAHGGAGATELAKVVMTAAKQPSQFQFLYSLDVRVTSTSTAQRLTY